MTSFTLRDLYPAGNSALAPIGKEAVVVRRTGLDVVDKTTRVVQPVATATEMSRVFLRGGRLILVP
jgi:hypothetical protein